MEGCFSDEGAVSGLRGGLRMSGTRMEGCFGIEGWAQNEWFQDRRGFQWWKGCSGLRDHIYDMSYVIICVIKLDQTYTMIHADVEPDMSQNMVWTNEKRSKRMKKGDVRCNIRYLGPGFQPLLMVRVTGQQKCTEKKTARNAWTRLLIFVFNTWYTCRLRHCHTCALQKKRKKCVWLFLSHFDDLVVNDCEGFCESNE